MASTNCTTSSADGKPGPTEARTGGPREETDMATKDKNAKKSMAKKPAQKTLKEKRQAKKNKA